MTPFFQSQASLRDLKCHSEKWIGTPFVPHAMVCGAGTDCVHLVAAIYIACGVFSKFDPPKYELDSGSHQKKSQVVAWLDDHPAFIRVSEPVQAGDCVCFRQRLSEHHVGLLIETNRFIHALERREVLVSSLEESFYRRRMTMIYRPIKL